MRGRERQAPLASQDDLSLIFHACLCLWLVLSIRQLLPQHIINIYEQIIIYRPPNLPDNDVKLLKPQLVDHKQSLWLFLICFDLLALSPQKRQ